MRGHKQHSPPRAVASRPLHSVERLQAVVDGIDATKRSHSKVLAKTVDSLNQNRRDCMIIKYKHFVVQHHLGGDIQHMRSASEAQRTETIEDTWYGNAWYHDLLKQLLARDAPLHPAEAFLVRAVRRIANDGHTFDQELLFRLLLLLHRDDLLVSEVQHMLTLLRQALHITLDEWESFFTTHRLPEPVEIYEREEQKQEKKMSRLSKFRAVVTLNQAVRHFSKVECNQ
uniref:Uncharacterized protein n=1 Tax=Globisporangium ultimum (strain ATCC 200006 / CBS 805.95 / DAOM BR144) TaxID=431595 RepID=K3XAU8_GLOUD